MEKTIKSVKPIWLLIIILVVAIVTIRQLSLLALESGLADLRQTADERIALYDNGLQGVLARMENLPYVMAHNDAVARLLVHNDNLDQLNRDLESLNYWAGTEALYVMNAAGDVVASSTWREPIDFIGKNFSFRPYFKEAKSGKQGHYFFAIGLETNKPGLYMSHGISREGQFLGVVVVKANLDPLLGDWREGRENVFITDEAGVIILSSHKEWLFKTLTALTPKERASLVASRRYNNQPLEKAPFSFKEGPVEGTQLVHVDDRDHLVLSNKNSQLNWTMTYLTPFKQVQQNVHAVIIIGSILTLLFMALGMYLRERQQKRLSRKKLMEAETIKQINLRLQEEIEEHYRTEQALRDTQAELVQTGKLAALGQMAAGIVHELNQPIAAIRTHAASGRLLLDRQEPDKLRETLASVARITEHMSEITAQLKSFAYKTPKRDEVVVFQKSLESALAIVTNLLSDNKITLLKEIPERPVYIEGSAAQLEQVFVNLARNSVDAMQGVSQKQLYMALAVDGGRLEFKVSDTGEGIAKENLDELFTPFFTTKEVGKGLGLGLSICYRIVSDLGGTIRAVNNADGQGATFTVSLPTVNMETRTTDG